MFRPSEAGDAWRRRPSLYPILARRRSDRTVASPACVAIDRRRAEPRIECRIERRIAADAPSPPPRRPAPHAPARLPHPVHCRIASPHRPSSWRRRWRQHGLPGINHGRRWRRDEVENRKDGRDMSSQRHTSMLSPTADAQRTDACAGDSVLLRQQRSYGIASALHVNEKRACQIRERSRS